MGRGSEQGTEIDLAQAPLRMGEKMSWADTRVRVDHKLADWSLLAFSVTSRIWAGGGRPDLLEPDDADPLTLQRGPGKKGQ